MLKHCVKGATLLPLALPTTKKEANLLVGFFQFVEFTLTSLKAFQFPMECRARERSESDW